MNMSRLKIIFAGVAAIGPAHPLDGKSAESPGPLFVVFPQASRRPSRSRCSRPFLGVHWPHITTTLKPREGSRQADRPATEDGGVNFFQPLRERLRFSFEGNWAPRKLVYEISSKRDLPDGDVRLLPDMRKIFPRRSVFKPGALDEKTIPEVAGQVFVPGGRISSSFGVKPRVTARFEPNAGAAPQDLAPELMVTVDGVTGVTIESLSLDTGDQLDAISFDVPTDNVIRFGSEDIGDIFRMLAGMPRVFAAPARESDADAPSFHDEPDCDFELYYSVLDGGSERDDLPIPIRQVPGAGSPIGADGNCYVTLVGGGH
ncbi:MAG: hypothetical protein QOI58_1528 [Thermoanaerobaculia bacterium]|jgi:hypothetical protein|nr:hypothetical protein [Thermoanaerobaculia bacterium]